MKNHVIQNCLEILIILKNFKEFEIFLWKKRRFRLRWDTSPGLSIAAKISNSTN